jgi:hypothetical protein
MSNADTTIILGALSDARNELTKSIGELHAEFQNFKGGMEVRVKAIEDLQQKQENRQWYHSTIVFSGGILHHALAQWLHWRM